MSDPKHMAAATGISGESTHHSVISSAGPWKGHAGPRKSTSRWTLSPIPFTSRFIVAEPSANWFAKMSASATCWPGPARNHRAIGRPIGTIVGAVSALIGGDWTEQTAEQ